MRLQASRPPPPTCEEHYADGLAVAVKLQPRRPNGIHDGSIVNCFHCDSGCARPELQICVCGGSAGDPGVGFGGEHANGWVLSHDAYVHAPRVPSRRCLELSQYCVSPVGVPYNKEGHIAGLCPLENSVGFLHVSEGAGLGIQACMHCSYQTSLKQHACMHVCTGHLHIRGPAHHLHHLPVRDHHWTAIKLLLHANGEGAALDALVA